MNRIHFLYVLVTVATVHCTVGDPPVRPADGRVDAKSKKDLLIAGDQKQDNNNECLSPRQICNSQCVSTATNMSHCGICANNCANILGARIDSCKSGVCICNAEGSSPCPVQQFCTANGCADECPLIQQCGINCCGVNQMCLDNSCCDSEKVCDGICCASNQSCTGTTCCSNSKACGDICCGALEACIDGSCCPSDRQCGTSCCSITESCIDGTCCPDESVCNGQCCGPNTICLEDSCCPDGKACGSACCSTTAFCFNWACEAPTPGVTVIYATTKRFNGNLGGRSGADAKCAAEKPSDFSCQTIAALLSVNVGDEIQDMTGPPYNFVANLPLFFFDRSSHHFMPCTGTWGNALDTETTPLQYNVKQGTGVSFYENYWTGSTSTGGYASAGSWDYTCGGWTTASTTGYELGTQGDPNDLVYWLHNTQNYLACTRELHLLCACKL